MFDLGDLGQRNLATLDICSQQSIKANLPKNLLLGRILDGKITKKNPRSFRVCNWPLFQLATPLPSEKLLKAVCPNSEILNYQKCSIEY